MTSNNTPAAAKLSPGSPTGSDHTVTAINVADTNELLDLINRDASAGTSRHSLLNHRRNALHRNRNRSANHSTARLPDNSSSRSSGSSKELSKPLQATGAR